MLGAPGQAALRLWCVQHAGGWRAYPVRTVREAPGVVNAAACLIVGLVERDEDRVERESHGEREQAIHAHVKKRVRNDRRIHAQLHSGRQVRRLEDGSGVRLRRRRTARHSERLRLQE